MNRREALGAMAGSLLLGSGDMVLDGDSSLEPLFRNETVEYDPVSPISVPPQSGKMMFVFLSSKKLWVVRFPRGTRQLERKKRADQC